MRVLRARGETLGGPVSVLSAALGLGAARGEQLVRKHRRQEVAFFHAADGRGQGLSESPGDILAGGAAGEPESLGGRHQGAAGFGGQVSREGKPAWRPLSGCPRRMRPFRGFQRVPL